MLDDVSKKSLGNDSGPEARLPLLWRERHVEGMLVKYGEIQDEEGGRDPTREIRVENDGYSCAT